MDEGTLFLIVGPSGAGKDSVIRYCRERADEARVSFPRRAITRPPGDANEDHEPISESEFGLRLAAGAFALHWQAHGLGYGIPASIGADLVGGRNVVVNVSRAVVAEARARFVSVVAVLVTAPADILAARLAGRGRESGEAVAGRLARQVDRPLGEPTMAIDNSGRLEAAGDALLRMIEATDRRG